MIVHDAPRFTLSDRDFDSALTISTVRMRPS